MSKLKTSFSGHDKFECKIDWITKGLQSYNDDCNIFSQSNIEQSIEKLGLGINMIKSLSYWMRVLGLTKDNKLSHLGKTILENDIYLENSDTLWILHWNLVKNIQDNTLVHLFFNQFYLYRFSKVEILNHTLNWLNNLSIKAPTTNTLSSDIDVLIRLYRSNNNDINMSLFSDLNFITSQSNDNYSLNINATTKISDDVFIYILSDFMDMLNIKDTNTISLDEIQRGRLSIQKSLCLGENSLYSKIYRLKELTKNKMYYSEASGIRQIYINDVLDTTDLLTQIYK